MPNHTPNLALTLTLTSDANWNITLTITKLQILYVYVIALALAYEPTNLKAYYYHNPLQLATMDIRLAFGQFWQVLTSF